MNLLFKNRTLRLLLMWVTAFALAGVVWLLIFLQMADNQENALATLLIKTPEEMNENITNDQFSEEDNSSKHSDNNVEEKISNDSEWSHLLETGSQFWEVIPIIFLINFLNPISHGYSYSLIVLSFIKIYLVVIPINKSFF